MSLRPYQSALVGEINAALAEHRSAVLQLPTGGGKTHIAAHVARRAAAQALRVWVICHRREIVGRPRARLPRSASRTASSPRAIPSRPTPRSWPARSRTSPGALPPPDLVIWDECHHVGAKSWSTLKARFPKARHLGLTATPIRLDGVGLGRFFDILVCGPSTATLMAAGHLSRYRLFAPTIPDLRGIAIRAGDYAKDQLGERMSGRALVGDVVEHYQRLAPGSRAVAFAVSVEASRAVAARFEAAGIPARYIDGTTPAAERDAAIADLEAGRIRVLSNVEVLSEGFDLPAIDAVILLRPTRSFALYRQMVGRGLRVAPGKGPTIILDHAGLVYEHDLPDDEVEWTLKGVRKRPGAPGAGRLRRCPACSAVHLFAAVCPECGHAYTAADRSMREVYGELRELGGRGPDEPPEGFDTIRGFARRAGTDPSFVRRLFAHGLPRSPDGFVPITEGLSWMAERRTGHHAPPPGSVPGEYEQQADFAQRVGMSKGGVAKLVKRGLPVGANGWVRIEPALAWLAEDRASRARPSEQVPAQKPPPQGEAVAAFAARLRVTVGVVRAALKRGMPSHPDGTVPVDAALPWWRANPPSTKGSNGPKGFESIKAFCRRVGVSVMGGRRGLLKKGLPVHENGFVHIESGLEWVRAKGLAS